MREIYYTKGHHKESFANRPKALVVYDLAGIPEQNTHPLRRNLICQ